MKIKRIFGLIAGLLSVSIALPSSASAFDGTSQKERMNAMLRLLNAGLPFVLCEEGRSYEYAERETNKSLLALLSGMRHPFKSVSQPSLAVVQIRSEHGETVPNLVTLCVTVSQ